MNAYIATFFCLMAVASASHVGLWAGHAVNPAAHIPSGSVSVGANGAVVAGPAGSVRTDNGLHGHGAGANLAGPAGDVRTHAGSVALSGPGNGHGDDGAWGGAGWGGAGHGVGVVAVAPVAVGGWGGRWGNGWGNGWSNGYGNGGWGNGAWGNGAWGNGGWGNGGWGHGHGW